MSILEEILEPSTGDSQTPDAPSNMAIIEGSSNVTIAGSHLNNVVGPQYNTIYHGNVTVQRVNRDSNERQRTLWDEVRSHSGLTTIITTNYECSVYTDPDMRRLYQAELVCHRYRKGSRTTKTRQGEIEGV